MPPWSLDPSPNTKHSPSPDHEPHSQSPDQQNASRPVSESPDGSNRADSDPWQSSKAQSSDRRNGINGIHLDVDSTPEPDCESPPWSSAFGSKAMHEMQVRCGGAERIQMLLG